MRLPGDAPPLAQVALEEEIPEHHSQPRPQRAVGGRRMSVGEDPRLLHQIVGHVLIRCQTSRQPPRPSHVGEELGEGCGPGSHRCHTEGTSPIRKVLAPVSHRSRVVEGARYRYKRPAPAVRLQLQRRLTELVVGQGAAVSLTLAQRARHRVPSQPPSPHSQFRRRSDHAIAPFPRCPRRAPRPHRRSAPSWLFGTPSPRSAGPAVRQLRVRRRVAADSSPARCAP